ncbi:peptidylprolyl isomerase [Winogradskyella sp. A3E31]|uniref:peptidylprolyl isomerase n=1 Tax=Winogradskyella sp. A3E31 TaxID=3349637 RepID=UPI00398AF50A
MAVLNKIRQRSLILILVIALALFSFVIGDLFKNSDALTGVSQDTIATVNGEDIKRDEFMFKVENYQRRVGPNSTSVQSMNAIYNQELRKIILETEYDELGLSVEKDKMRDLLKNTFQSYPEFQNQDSVYDVNRLNAFIANLKEIAPQAAPLGNVQVNYQSWTDNEQAIASGALQQQYYNLIKAGVGASLVEAKDEHVAGARSVDVKYVQIPYTSIADSLVKVTKSEIKAYMEKHKEQYQVDATREIVYVEFREDASIGDEDEIKNNLIALKQDRVEFSDVTKTTDTIVGFDNTTNVEAFVNSNSDIKYNDAYLRVNQLPVAERDSLLAANVGDYYGPYKDAGYYKLSKVLAKETRPDSVKVRHILIPYVGANRVDPSITYTKEKAEAKADSILNVVKGNRSKFLEVLDLSSDKVSNENEGIIEFTYNQAFAPEFKAFSFDNQKGDVDVVETSFGYHIIEILDQSAFNPTIKLATVAREIEPSEETIDAVFNAVSKFEIAAENGDFTELAKERELAVKPATFKELDENIPGLGSQRQVVRWAFNDDTEVGEYKRFSIAGVGFIVAQLVDINKEGLMSVDNATTPVLIEVRKEKKAEMIRAKITATTVDEIASNQGQSPRTASGLTLKNTTLTGAGVEPKVVGTALGLAQGATSKPIDGEKGVFVVEVTAVKEAQELDNFSAIQSRLTNARRNTVQTKVYAALEKKAEIEDNRAKTVY